MAKDNLPRPATGMLPPTELEIAITHISDLVRRAASEPPGERQRQLVEEVKAALAFLEEAKNPAPLPGSGAKGGRRAQRLARLNEIMGPEAQQPPGRQPATQTPPAASGVDSKLDQEIATRAEERPVGPRKPASPGKEEDQGEKLPALLAAYRQATVAADADRARMAAQLQGPFSGYVKALPQGTIEEKRELAKWINAELRLRGMALECPNTGAASVLQVHPGDYPDIGRFQYYHYEGGEKALTASRTKLPEVELILADLQHSQGE